MNIPIDKKYSDENKHKLKIKIALINKLNVKYHASQR